MDTNYSVQATVNLCARLMPMDRGELYEDPLNDALAEHALGEVVGGGTAMSPTGEVDSVDLELALADADEAVAFVIAFLEGCGAPAGSTLRVERGGESLVIAFGFLQGLAVYLNGTELGDDVYASCDVNDTVSAISDLLGSRGNMQSHWVGPTETALYLYGYDADEMRALIAPRLASDRLCARARVVAL